MDRIASGHVRLGPVQTYSLDQIRQAHDDMEKNRILPPNQYANDTHGYARNLATTWRCEGKWLGEPDVARWIATSRLNLLRALPEHQSEARAIDAVTTYLTHVGPAVGQLQTFAKR